MSITINHIGTSACTITYVIRDNHGVLSGFNITPEDLLQLCGGIPDQEQLFANVDIESITSHAVKVIVDSNLYRVCRTINLKRRVIFNDKMRVYEKNKGIGTNLFLNQVVFARRLGFIKLTVVAIDYDGDEKVDGYYRWARLGYQMIDRNDLEDFADMMRALRRPEKTVGELVLTEDGYNIWKISGQDWIGEFQLADESESMEHLYRYLALKSFDFKP